MKLQRAEVLPYRLPLVSLLGGQRWRQGFVLRLRSLDGGVGYGEASPIWWTGEESLEAAERALAKLAARVNQGDLSGRDVEGATDGCVEPGIVGEVHRLSPSAACALATAVLDLEAKREGKTVAGLLGAQGECTMMRCNALVVADEPGRVRAAIGAVAARGFRTVKIKVGSRPLEVDVERIAAARSAGIPGLRLRLDANRRWDAGTAHVFLKAVAGQDIEYVEEPLRDPTPEALARLRAETGVPIAADESIRCTADVSSVAAAGACDAIVLKPGRVGGPAAVLRIARIAEDAGLRVVCTDSIETAVGRAAVLHTAAALGTGNVAVGLGGSMLLARDVLDGDPPVPGPRQVAGGPGLGLPELPKELS